MTGTTKRKQSKPSPIDNYYELCALIAFALQTQMKKDKRFRTIHLTPYKNGVQITFD